jgi:hypothetical protein
MLSIQERDIKAYLANFLQKIFAQNSSWLNYDVELITLTDNNAPNVFEQYPWDAEHYPIVALTGMGASSEQWGIDGYISARGLTNFVGTRANSFVSFAGSKIAFGFQMPADVSYTMRNIEIMAKYAGELEEPITVELCSASGTTTLIPGTVLSTGTLKVNAFDGLKWLQAKLLPNIVLAAGTKYFVTLNTAAAYPLMMDTTPDAAVTPFVSFTEYTNGAWTEPDLTKTVLAKVNGPVYTQLGGGISSNFSIYIEAKDLSTVQKIANLIYMYLFLARHSNLARPNTVPNLPATSMDYSFMSDLTEAGIYVINVDKGAEGVRNRGNDRIFNITITAHCYSQWSEDYTLPELSGIHIDTGDY